MDQASRFSAKYLHCKQRLDDDIHDTTPHLLHIDSNASESSHFYDAVLVPVPVGSDSQKRLRSGNLT